MAAPTFLYWNGRNGRALSTVYKKLLPGALLWDYENWPKIKITREGWRGSPALSVLSVLFFPPVLAGSVLGWARLGWVRLLLPVPRTQGPFFPLCQSKPDVPRLVLRILIPYLGLLSEQKIWRGTYSRTQTEIHTHIMAGTHTNTAG